MICPLQNLAKRMKILGSPVSVSSFLFAFFLHVFFSFLFVFFSMWTVSFNLAHSFVFVVHLKGARLLSFPSLLPTHATDAFWANHYLYSLLIFGFGGLRSPNSTSTFSLVFYLCLFWCSCNRRKKNVTPLDVTKAKVWCVSSNSFLMCRPYSICFYLSLCAFYTISWHVRRFVDRKNCSSWMNWLELLNGQRDTKKGKIFHIYPLSCLFYASQTISMQLYFKST